MSRSTQYIGLTRKAERWLDKQKRMPYKSFPPVECTGMFGEEVGLGVWTIKYRGVTRVVREVVQDEPWSSGPMIFTCLAIAHIDDTSGEIFDRVITLSEWKLDKKLAKDHRELDYDKGTYWV